MKPEKEDGGLLRRPPHALVGSSRARRRPPGLARRPAGLAELRPRRGDARPRRRLRADARGGGPPGPRRPPAPGHRAALLPSGRGLRAGARRGRAWSSPRPPRRGKSLCYNLPVLRRASRASPRRARSTSSPPRRSRAIRRRRCARCMREAGLEPRRHHLRRRHAGRRAPRGARAQRRGAHQPGHAAHRASCRTTRTGRGSFQNLRYVVIDELHTYRGVFGSHLANVLRRLQRVARFHGSNPTFILALGHHRQPAEHAARMLGRARWRSSIRERRAAGRAPRHGLQPAGGERGARHPRQLPEERGEARGGPGARAACPRSCSASRATTSR